MNNPGLDGLERLRQDSWLKTTYLFLRDNLTAANIVGIIGAATILFLLLALHEPWNMRVPFYLTIFIWSMLRPRVALYLTPIAVPWASLDTMTLAGLHMDGADLLVGFLVVAWLLSFAL